MREAFDLNLRSLDRMSMLIHGNYGVGKTYFIGDMLRTEATRGDVRFLNIRDEDGHLTLADLDLGNIGVHVDTLKDFKEVAAEFKAANLRALGLDGLPHLGRLIIRHVCGDSLPRIAKDSDDWQRIHREFEVVIPALRHIAPIVMVASSSDRSMDQISGQISLTPDLPGRQAAGVAGKFDFVFVMTAQPIGPNRMKRALLTQPVANTVIRSRLPRPLPPEITMPEGEGGWKVLLDAMNKTLTGRAKA